MVHELLLSSDRALYSSSSSNSLPEIYNVVQFVVNLCYFMVNCGKITGGRYTPDGRCGDGGYDFSMHIVIDRWIVSFGRFAGKLQHVAHR